MAAPNSVWHKRHPMPSAATLDQRVRWHLAHAKACGCRAVPATVVAELKRRKIPVPKRASRQKA
jgi:hypothetical protein